MMHGDLVVRKSYGRDLVFKLRSFEGQMAQLLGYDFRLSADAPISDLETIKDAKALDEFRSAKLKPEAAVQQIMVIRKKLPGTDAKQRGPYPYFELPGKVLHLDGDPEFLRKSMAIYGELRVPAEGHYVEERNMPDMLHVLLPKVRPDIVVITGHDGLIKHKKHEPYQLTSYKNSVHFVSAVRMARQYEKNKDGLTIVAGACQSYFEALLQAGANFASSPGRILIHALDPVSIAARAAFTSVRDTVNLPDVVNNTFSGIEGVGGIETRGSYRIGLPKL